MQHINRCSNTIFFSLNWVGLLSQRSSFRLVLSFVLFLYGLLFSFSHGGHGLGLFDVGSTISISREGSSNGVELWGLHFVDYLHKLFRVARSQFAKECVVQNNQFVILLIQAHVKCMHSLLGHQLTFHYETRLFDIHFN